MENIFTRMSLAVGLVMLLSVASLAQQTTPPAGVEGQRVGRMKRERMGGKFGERGGPRGHGMERRALRRLNLTDAQRGQLREIEARYGQNFKAQRQELRQLMELRRSGAALTPEQEARAAQLRAEARDNGEKLRAEILAILTPEQREQLKQMREEHRSRREERRRGGFGKPTDKQ